MAFIVVEICFIKLLYLAFNIQSLLCLQPQPSVADSIYVESFLANFIITLVLNITLANCTLPK